MSTDFGKQIKSLRERAKMTQTDLARTLGVSKSVISAYEKGIRNPSFKVLKDISVIFNVSEVYLLINQSDNDYTNTIDISGLTANQQELIESLIREFRFTAYKEDKNED